MNRPQPNVNFSYETKTNLEEEFNKKFNNIKSGEKKKE